MAPSEGLSVRGVSVVLGTNRVLDAVDVEVGVGETVALLGPSGSGKSTLLRAIAGLEPLEHGAISLGGADLDGVPPQHRGVGLMFQDGALFPHVDVRGNVAFGLRMAGAPPAERDARVAEVLELVGLSELSNRRISQLSGGEQQRVALARTLAPRPRALLLDEPLGALDRLLHDRLVEDLRTVLRTAGVPALVVTHDHDEAMALADRIVLLREGCVVQSDAPARLWRAPRSESVARFLGFGPVLDATISGSEAATRWGIVPVAAGARDGAARLVLRPESLALGSRGALSGVVADVRFRATRLYVRVQLENGPAFDVGLPPDTSVDDAPDRGVMVAVTVAPGGALVYPPEGAEGGGGSGA